MVRYGRLYRLAFWRTLNISHQVVTFGIFIVVFKCRGVSKHRPKINRVAYHTRL